MKKIFLWTLFLCGVSLWSRAQSQLPITIDKVQVSYQSVPSASVSIVNDRPDIRLKSQVLILLRANTSIEKIYLEVFDVQNNIIYAVNYVIGAGSVTDPQGFTLFDIDGNTIHINNPNTVSLAPYTYKVHTEDVQGNSSAELSIQQ